MAIPCVNGQSPSHRLPPPPPLLILIPRLVQGLIGVPLPNTSQLLCRKRLLFPSRVLSIGCVLIFFPLVYKEKGKKEKKIEKSYFDLKAVPFRSISVYCGKGYKGKEEIRTIYRFFLGSSNFSV